MTISVDALINQLKQFKKANPLHRGSKVDVLVNPIGTQIFLPITQISVGEGIREPGTKPVPIFVLGLATPKPVEPTKESPAIYTGRPDSHKAPTA